MTKRDSWDAIADAIAHKNQLTRPLGMTKAQTQELADKLRTPDVGGWLNMGRPEPEPTAEAITERASTKALRTRRAMLVNAKKHAENQPPNTIEEIDAELARRRRVAKAKAKRAKPATLAERFVELRELGVLGGGGRDD
jgi:hypothetical protein